MIHSDSTISILAFCRYLYQLINSNGWLPRRQEAEDDTCEVTGKKKSALVTHQEVRDWGDGRRDAMIVSVSHAWETREHPDPCRFQLQNLVDCVSLYDAAYSSDLWLFYDYTSLYQWRRDAKEELSYQRAMRNVQVLYAHKCSVTFRMERLTPDDMWTAAENDPTFKVPIYHGPSRQVVPLPLKELVRNTNLYLVRGWCLAEREWSASRSVPDQNVAIDEGSGEDQEIKKIPTSPEVFNQRMAQSVFTHRVDCESVIELQKKIFHTKVTIRKHLVLEDLTKDDVDELVASLPHYRSLKVLEIRRFSADVEQAIAFAQAKPPLTSFLHEHICWESWGVQAVFLSMLESSILHGRLWDLCLWRSCCYRIWKVLKAPEMPWPRLGHWDSVRSDFCGSLWSLHQALGEILKEHESLKELKLWMCQVGDLGAQAQSFAILIGGISNIFLKFG